jgi:hypothetical protein
MYPMRKSIVGVSGMGWQRANKRVLACMAVFGAGGIAGLLAGFSEDPVQTSEPSPAEIVALRFPGGWNRIAASSIVLPPAPAAIDAAPAGFVLASVEEDAQASSLIFNPFPTYSTSPRPSLPPQLVTASVEMPAAVLAYSALDAAEPAMPAARPESPNAAPAMAKRAIQPPRPASPASQAPASPSNAVLNNAQIASIRERLKLTSYQVSLWPPVESALRDISWRQGRADAGARKLASNALSNPRGGTIDPDSVPVQRLKSAAFPLIMSLSDDQKQEVRTMVRLMGLENLASQF